MEKWKAITIDVIISVLLVGVWYLSLIHDVWTFPTISAAFAVYGFVQFVRILYIWLMTPKVEQPEDPPIPVAEVPDSWINPFEEDQK